MADQSAEGEEQSVKRQKLSWGKLCAVWTYDGEEDTESLIGILDLDLDSSLGFGTQIRLPCDIVKCEAPAFCALGSTLFVFEGWYPPTVSSNENAGKSVYKIDLQSLATRTGDVKLNREMVPKTYPLQHPKVLPRAIQVPGDDNTIIVFSQVCLEESLVLTRFELYHAKGWSCEVLPQLEMGNWIYFYGFVNKSKFLVQLEHVLLMMLDLDMPGKGWQPVYRSDNGLDWLGGQQFYVLKNRYFFTGGAVYDFAHVCPYPQEYPQNYETYGVMCPNGDWYDNKDEARYFCVCGMGIWPEGEHYCGVTVNLYRAVVKDCKTLEEKDAQDEEDCKKLKEKDSHDEDDFMAVVCKCEQSSDDRIDTKVIKTIEFEVEKYPSILPCYAVIF